MLTISGTGSVNGARGSLRSELLRGLYSPLEGFHVQKCTCRKESHFAYHEGLLKTELLPLHDYYRKSIKQVLDSPGFINFGCEIPEGACYTCREKLSETAIKTTRQKLLNDFDGLCLDCIKMTKTGDVDEDYWYHDFQQVWDNGCRIRHGQSTWYFSFM